MSENFEKLKKKYRRVALVKSAVAGASCGLFVVGVLLLALKLCAVSLHAGYYVLIGVCAALACGGAAYLFLRPSERKVAKKLDDEYALHEKVQTMVAYREEEGAMVSLQREDAGEKLGRLNVREATFRKIWMFILIPVLAVAVFASAVAVPAAEKQDIGPIVQPDPPADITEFQTVSLNNLIEEVRSSSLTDTKEPVVAKLVSLRDSLGDIETQSALERAVRATIADVDEIFNAADTYIPIGNAMRENELTEWLYQLFLNGMTAYQGYPVYQIFGKFTSFDQVRSVESLIEGYIGGEGGANEAYLAPVKKEYAELDDEESMREKLQALSEALAAGLEKSAVPQDDALYAATADFAEGLNAVLAKLGNGYAVATLQNNIAAAFDGFAASDVAPLDRQAYNVVMDDYVRRTLADIFGITPPSNETSGIPDVVPDDNEKNEENGGGAGREDILYGGNGYVFDPNTEQQVQYGEVLEDYYAKALELILSADLSDEMRDYILEYYSILYSGLEEEE